jgi:hypothetical protein
MLDNIRITLLKRAFVSPGELFDLSSSQVDQLLETNYGANWKDEALYRKISAREGRGIRQKGENKGKEN